MSSFFFPSVCLGETKYPGDVLWPHGIISQDTWELRGLLTALLTTTAITGVSVSNIHSDIVSFKTSDGEYTGV
jgi:hypothetical protein